MNTKRMAAVRRKSSAPPPAPRLQSAEQDESDELPAVLPHQRTLRDLYSDAVRARVALKPNERNFDENPSRMSAGEMLLRTLGGAV